MLNLLQLKQQRTLPPIVPVSLFCLQQPGLSQILHGPADGGFGVFEFPGNGGDGGPAGIVPVGPVGQVNVDRHRPVGQVLAPALTDAPA